MKRILGVRLIGALLSACMLVLTNNARAVDAPWPAGRPIRMIIAGGAGSGTDIFGRQIAMRLGQALQQAIVVENKPGANGIIANDFIAKANPDGYSLLFSNASSVALNPAIQEKLPYNTLKDLIPVAQVGSGGVLLVVTPDVPAKDLATFVKYVKAHPDQLSYASWGTGSTGHLSMEALKAQAGLKLNHVPYKTMGQVLTDLQGGIVRIAFVDAASPLPFLKTGSLVPIGVTGTHRLPMLPDLKTTEEQGYKLGADGWYGLFAPKGTPATVVDRLNKEVNKILTAAEIQPVLRTLNLNQSPATTPASFAVRLRDDLAVWREIARAGNLAMDQPIEVK